MHKSSDTNTLLNLIPSQVSILRSRMPSMWPPSRTWPRGKYYTLLRLNLTLKGKVLTLPPLKVSKYNLICLESLCNPSMTIPSTSLHRHLFDMAHDQLKSHQLFSSQPQATQLCFPLIEASGWLTTHSHIHLETDNSNTKPVESETNGHLTRPIHSCA